jgi:hypothetical protein
MIAVVDLASGETSHRPGDTLTLDVPLDFDRRGVVSLDPRSLGHYIATDGNNRKYAASTRPLSGRARGEECLVAVRNDPVSTPWMSAYRLTAIEPLRS